MIVAVYAVAIWNGISEIFPLPYVSKQDEFREQSAHLPSAIEPSSSSYYLWKALESHEC